MDLKIFLQNKTEITHYNLLKKIENEIIPVYAPSLSCFKLLSFGNFGQTFHYNNIVIKITTDDCEAKIATKLISQKCDNLANIYHVFRVNQKYSIIIQEELNTTDLKFNEAIDYIFGIMEERLLTLPDIMAEFSLNEVIKNNLFLNCWCPELSINIIQTAYQCASEVYQRTGFPANDFNISNFGLKNGIIAAFDHTII